MSIEHIDKNLTALTSEFNVGKEQLKVLQQQTSDLEKTLLRISGAIQALEELKSDIGAVASTDTGRLS